MRIIASLALALLASISLADPSASESRFRASGLLTVAKQDYQNRFQLEATIEAVNESTLSAQTSGRVQFIHFDVNDYVKKGTLLIQLRDKNQKSSLKRAMAQLVQFEAENENAQLELTRSIALYAESSLSKRKFDSIKAQSIGSAAAVKAAQALLDQAQEQMAYTQVHAPYSGIVKSLHVQVGESVSVGSNLMTGLSLDQLRVVAHIPQRLAAQITQQQDFQIIHRDQIIAAQKVTIFPYADASTHSFKVRVNINSQGLNLFPGMWVKLSIPMGIKTTIQVPKSSVMVKGELSSVFINGEKGAILRQVRLGQEQDGQIEILAGLKEGEEIFIDSYRQLSRQVPK
ncbi:MAG: efflux RND transporter periplasmic adaptor subunit [Bermanella sp.]